MRFSLSGSVEKQLEELLRREYSFGGTFYQYLEVQCICDPIIGLPNPKLSHSGMAMFGRFEMM